MKEHEQITIYNTKRQSINTTLNETTRSIHNKIKNNKRRMERLCRDNGGTTKQRRKDVSKQTKNTSARYRQPNNYSIDTQKQQHKSDSRYVMRPCNTATPCKSHTHHAHTPPH